MTREFIKFQYLLKKIFVYKDNIEIETPFKVESIKISQVKSTTVSMLGTRLKVYIDSDKSFDIDLISSKKIKDLSDYINNHISFDDLHKKYNNENGNLNSKFYNSHVFEKTSAKIIGFILLFFGFSGLFSNFIFGLLILIAGFIIFPKTNSFIEEKTNKTFSKKSRSLVALVLIFASFLVIDNSSSNVSSNNITNNTEPKNKLVEDNINNKNTKKEGKGSNGTDSSNLNSKKDNEVSTKKDFETLSRERFDQLEAAWNEESADLENIECYNNSCNSVVYFNFNEYPNDLEFVVRGNTATFSNFKLKNTGTSHVTVFARLNGNTIFQCDGSKGVVDSCK